MLVERTLCGQTTLFSGIDVSQDFLHGDPLQSFTDFAFRMLVNYRWYPTLEEDLAVLNQLEYDRSFASHGRQEALE
jgi:hypothetical protein